MKMEEGTESFRGYGLTEDFARKFKASKFYQEVYDKHRDELILGIRDGYMNMYFNCDNLSKLKYRSRKFISEVNEYYTQDKSERLTDEQFVQQYEYMKSRSNAREKQEKQAQEKLFLANNSNPAAEWFCVDVEYTKSESGEMQPGRFDIVAISKAAPHRLALIELKYGAAAIGGTSGIRKHVKDFYTFYSEGNFKRFKEEMVSILQAQDRIGVNVPDPLKNIELSSIADQPEFYFITLNNNADEAKGSTPKMTMDGYLFKDKRWNSNRLSTLVNRDGDYASLIHKDKHFNATFLFSTAQLPDLNIHDIINDPSYDREKVNV